MKIVFADTFFKSLKKLSRHKAWWYKTYEIFRYGLPNYFRNVKHFRKELWKYRTWDSCYSLMLFKRGIELNANCIEKYGNEIEESRIKKLSKMRRTVLLLDNYSNDKYLRLAEKQTGIKINSKYLFSEDYEPQEISDANSKVFAAARRIEEDEWSELWHIIKGESGNISYDESDGSGIKGWWD